MLEAGKLAALHGLLVLHDFDKDGDLMAKLDQRLQYNATLQYNTPS